MHSCGVPRLIRRRTRELRSLIEVLDSQQLLGSADGEVLAQRVWRKDWVSEHARPPAHEHVAPLNSLADLTRRPSGLAHEDLKRRGFLSRD